jgi:glycolate oxidase iron-sulfur subunit
MSQAAAPRFLADVYEDASRCNKCSLCQAVCPTYVINPVEWETARGRVSLIRDAIEGKIELRDIADGPLSTCLTCNNCMSACAPKVPTATIVNRARQELHAQEGQPWRQSFWLRTVLPRPGALRFANRVSKFAQATGLRQLAVRAGFTRWMGITGAMALRAGPPPPKTAYELLAQLPPANEPVRARLGFMVCCLQNLAAPEATAATARVLLANGLELVIPEMGCSGLPARSLGDADAELEAAAANVPRLSALDVDAYVSDVASCGAQWQRYGEVLDDDRVNGKSGADIAARTWLASDLLARQGLRRPLGAMRIKVAIDEPCSLPLDTEVRGAARSLLSQIPHLELVELDEAAMCCGGPGLYAHSQPERSEAILARKFENVRASGAEVLVTENISCLLQLRDGAARYAPQVRVAHLFELLDEAISRGAPVSPGAPLAARV